MNLFTKTRKELFESDNPISTAELPIPRLDDMHTGGHDVNLILMVKEHAPRRLDNIEKELAKLQKQMQDLQNEASIITKLYEVVVNG